MRPRATDDELDAVLSRLRLDTGGDAPAGLLELIRAASFERQPGTATRVLAFGALSACVLMLAVVVLPAVATAVATLSWLLPIVSFAWVALRTPP